MGDDRHDDRNGRAELDDTPPLLGSWRTIYLVVLGTLVVLVIVFALLTQAYA